jgi:hypothetical protein
MLVSPAICAYVYMAKGKIFQNASPKEKSFSVCHNVKFDTISPGEYLTNINAADGVALMPDAERLKDRNTHLEVFQTSCHSPVLGL